MIDEIYHHSDLELLTGSKQALEQIKADVIVGMSLAEEACIQIGASVDVPAPLRAYFNKTGGALGAIHARLKSEIDEVVDEGLAIFDSVRSSLENIQISDDVLNGLERINGRLKVLERSLSKMIEEVHSRCNQVGPPSVEWDEWDSFEIILYLAIKPDFKRPSYDPDDGPMEFLQKTVTIYCNGPHYLKKRDKDYWGLDDGKDHGTYIPYYGHLLRQFDDCYLFHALYDHAEVGLWGILHLRSIDIEIIPHRSGRFTI